MRLSRSSAKRTDQWASQPYPSLDLDAEMEVYRQLADLLDQHSNTPACGKFRAELKPVTSTSCYVAHLLEVLEARAPADLPHH